MIIFLIMGNNRLYFFASNESMDAIKTGIDAKPDDIVCSIGGSLDQALALLEIVSFVDVVDKNPTQIEYAKQLLKFLESGDYCSFFDRTRFIASDGTVSYPNKQTQKNIESTKEYFCDGDRIKKISEKLERICIHEPRDIFVDGIPNKKYSKIYLSNALTPPNGNREINFRIQSILGNFTNSLESGGIIYTSNHGRILRENPLSNFLPESLQIDLNLSASAQALEKPKWSPLSYRKV